MIQAGEKPQKFTIYHVNLLMIVFLAIINCRGIRVLLPNSLYFSHIWYYRVFTVYSILLSMVLIVRYSGKRYRIMTKYCMAFVGLFILPQILYVKSIYGQSVLQTLNASIRFLYVFWCFPILHVISHDGSVDRLMKVINAALVICYLSVLINSLMINYLGVSLYQQEFLAYRNGRVRLLDLSSLAPLTILYSFEMLLMGKKRYALCLTIYLVCMVYVEQTRALLVAILGSMAMMFLLKKRKAINRYVLWTATIIIIIGVISLGVLSLLLAQFSVQNNGVSTLNRISEMDFYIERFNENKLFGMGALSEASFESVFRMERSVMNDEDVGIIGVLGCYGLTSIVVFFWPVFRFGRIILKLCKRSSIEHMDYLVGLFFYVIFTSPTLVFVNFQRIPILCFLIAIFEFSLYKKNGNAARLILDPKSMGNGRLHIYTRN